MATSKQLAYAKRIEETLDVQMPSSMDRYTISQFISAYHKEFLQKEREGNKKIESRIKEEIPIADIAREMGFSVVKKGRYLSLKEHDSVIIDTERNCFWRNSRSRPWIFYWPWRKCHRFCGRIFHSRFKGSYS